MKGLAFIVTDKCNITCDFCAPGCGPHLKGNLSAKIMKNVFKRLRDVGSVPIVIFTGGEPMLFKKDIIETIIYIKDTSDAYTRIVTNAYWARSFKAAKQELKVLKDAGLTELNYSVDDFHQVYIPEIRIKYAVEAALELEIPVLLAHKTYRGSASSKETYEKLLGQNIPYLQDLPPEKIGRILLTFNTGYTLPIGRRSEKVDLDLWIPDEIQEDKWRGPCSQVLKYVQITPSGRLSPCCGLVDRNIPIFYAGNIIENDLIKVIEDANKNVIYNWLALMGPSAIMDYIKSHDSSIKFSGKYIQNCQICQEVFGDELKLNIISSGLTTISKILSLYRCVFEAQRAAFIEKLNS